MLLPRSTMSSPRTSPGTRTPGTRTSTGCCWMMARIRAGGLVEGDKLGDTDLVASDAGIDGGAATAEEAAVHVVEEEDYDIRSE